MRETKQSEVSKQSFKLRSCFIQKIVLLIFLSTMTSVNAQVDSIWQSYYDSSDVYWNKGDFEQTITWLEKGKLHLENTLEKSKMDSTYNLTLNDIAICLIELGLYLEANQILLECIKNTEVSKGKNHPDYGIRLFSLANLYYETNHYEKSLKYLELSWECRKNEEIIDSFFYSQYLGNSALLNELLGNYERAIVLYKESQVISIRDKDYKGYCMGLLNLGSFYRKIGRSEEAFEALYRASKTWEEKFDSRHPEYTLILNEFAKLYRQLGLNENAIMLLKESLSIIKEKLGVEHPKYGLYMSTQAGLYLHMNSYEEALRMYNKALVNFKINYDQSDRYYVTLINNMGKVYEKIGDFERALANYTFAVNNGARNYSKNSKVYVKFLDNLSNLNKIIRNYEAGMVPLVSSIYATRNRVDQVLTISNQKNKSDFLSILGNKFHQYHTFAYASNYQFDTLNQILYNNELHLKNLVLNSTQNTFESIKQKGDSTLINQFTEWKNLKNQLSRQYSKPIADRIHGVDSLERIANNLEEDLVIQSSEFAEVRKEVKWRDVQKALDSSEVAIEFVNFQYYNKEITDTNFYAAMLVKPEAKSVEYILLFEEKELEQIQIQAQNQTQIEDQVVNLYSNQSGLYKLLWSKIEPHLQDIETIYFSPSGLLHKINFNAIQDSEGNYLMNKYNLVQLNSTREIVNKSKEQFQPKNASIALYGNIDYNLNSEDQLLAEEHKQNDSVDLFAIHRGPQILEDDSRKTLWRKIVGSKKEVKKIRKLWPNRKTKLLEAHQASEQTFKSMEGENAPNIYHLATHGFFFEDVKDTLNTTFGESTYRASDNPLLRSGLIMAGANYVWQGNAPLPNKEDGILTALEISNLNLLNTELVVLSACESGLGDIKGSEGVFGLQRAFKMAGVDNLIMSLWKVPDAETEMLMTQFYKNWKRGYDLRSAFKIAQQKMSEKYSPYYWAGFVLIGEVEEERLPGKRFPKWVLILGGLIGLGMIGYGIKRVS